MAFAAVALGAAVLAGTGTASAKHPWYGHDNGSGKWTCDRSSTNADAGPYTRKDDCEDAHEGGGGGNDGGGGGNDGGGGGNGGGGGGNGGGGSNDRSEPAVTGGPEHAGYCSVLGNSNPFTAAPYAPGTFLNLVFGQNLTDPHYQGAVPAIFVEGIGITCDPPPVGFSFDGKTFVNEQGDGGFPDSIYAFFGKQ